MLWDLNGRTQIQRLAQWMVSNKHKLLVALLYFLLNYNKFRENVYAYL